MDKHAFLDSLMAATTVGLNYPIRPATVVRLEKLECPSCDERLAVTGSKTCECDYCDARYFVENLDEITNDESAEVSWDDDAYFYAGPVTPRVVARMDGDDGD